MTPHSADRGCLLVLLGPTASGKESSAIHAAEHMAATGLPGSELPRVELVVCDSVKPYRGLGIAAAAPPAAHVGRVPHHVVDCIDPREPLNAARWVALAEAAIADIRSRGLRPLVVGGTALYLKALLFGLFDGPPADPALRAELRAIEAATPGALHARLTSADPAAATRIHPHDLKRLLRALEVHAATGRPISEAQQQWTAGPRVAYRAVGLRRTREDLRDRIERRVRRMVDQGLLAEVAARQAEGALGPTAIEAIGVKELLPLVASAADVHAIPASELAAALESIRAHTWQLARRQINWWKHFPEVHWLDVAADESPAETGRRVADAFARTTS